MNRNILFVHDGPMYRDESGHIYGIHYKDRIVDRYAFLGKQVVFLMREKPLDGSRSASLSRITRSNFSFIPIPDFKSIYNFFTNKNQAIEIIKSAVSKADILVARMPSAVGSIAIEEAIKIKKPYLVEMVACTYDAYWNYNWQGKLIAHYKYWKIKRIISYCPYVVYVTKQFLQNRYPSKGKSTNISNVELLPYENAHLQARITQIDKRKCEERLILGTVAAINVPYKGQDDVIRTIGRLKRKGVIIHYHIVGQGDPSRLASIIEREGVHDQVKILGSMKHEEVFQFLKKIDMYIQPSKQEGLPRALIEAMSMGCPAFGARTAGIPELLDESCIFQPGNVKEIVRKLEEINIDWMKEQAKKNFETAKAYESPVLEERRLAFYKMFLKENGFEY